MKKRTKSRTWAVQVAYTMHLSGLPCDYILRDFFRWRRIGVQNRELTVQLVNKLDEHLDAVDEAIADHLKNWSPERLARLDRIILRLGVAELLYLDDIPPKVTINEYVELSRLFGTEESPGFVNGVLDAIRRDHLSDMDDAEASEGEGGC
jgi:transcription antitermination protein NusB